MADRRLIHDPQGCRCTNRSPMIGSAQGWLRSVRNRPADHTVLGWLRAREFAPSTIDAYQGHLNRWFDLHGAK